MDRQVLRVKNVKQLILENNEFTNTRESAFIVLTEIPLNNGDSVANEIYFYRIKDGDFIMTKKCY